MPGRASDMMLPTIGRSNHGRPFCITLPIKQFERYNLAICPPRQTPNYSPALSTPPTDILHFPYISLIILSQINYFKQRNWYFYCFEEWVLQ